MPCCSSHVFGRGQKRGGREAVSHGGTEAVVTDLGEVSALHNCMFLSGKWSEQKKFSVSRETQIIVRKNWCCEFWIMWRLWKESICHLLLPAVLLKSKSFLVGCEFLNIKLESLEIFFPCPESLLCLFLICAVSLKMWSVSSKHSFTVFDVLNQLQDQWNIACTKCQQGV